MRASVEGDGEIPKLSPWRRRTGEHAGLSFFLARTEEAEDRGYWLPGLRFSLITPRLEV